MPRQIRRRNDAADLEKLIEEITTDAFGDDEQFWAFRQALEDHLGLPAAAFVIGEPVLLTAIEYDGNIRRGLTARCKRSNGSMYVVAASDLAMLPEAPGAPYLAAYHAWVGVGTTRRVPATRERVERNRLPESLEVAILSVKKTAACCRMLAESRNVIFRTDSFSDLIPGEIATVKPNKLWIYAGRECLSGTVLARRLDVLPLGLVPLRLESRALWDPAEEYWGEEGEPLPKWAKAIIACGPRPAFEMEQVIPGQDLDDIDSDPIIESNDLKDAGDAAGARRLLMELCEADLRCLDAHSHLGHLAFRSRPREAMRHYEAGIRIGELSLPENFQGLLPWGWIDNRPFLRCLQGYGLCLWRIRRFKEAEQVFHRMLWLNPTDNQGVRFLIDPVRKKETWRDDE